MFRTFVGYSQSQLQLQNPEQHRVKLLSTFNDNSRWPFVLTFYENQSIETVASYLPPGILELYGFAR